MSFLWERFRSDFYYMKNDALGEKDSNMIFITWKTMNGWKIFRSDFYNMKNNEFKR